VLAIWIGCAAVGAMSSATPRDVAPVCAVCLQPPATSSAPTPAPLTTLRTRDSELAIYAICGELRYSVITRSGELAMHLGTEAELMAGFPDLAAHVDSALAEDAAWIDASVTAPSRRDGTAGAKP